MHFKIRTKLIIAFLIMLFATMGVAGVVAWYNQTVLHNVALKHQGIFTEMELVSHTQLKLDKVLMPGNDYIITGNKRFIKDFEMVSVELEDRIRAVEKYISEIRAEPDVIKEEKRILEDVKLAWANIREISLRIFAIPNPVGNMDAVRLMEEMDYKWSYPAIEKLEKWHKVDIEEYKEVMENMEKVWVRSWVIMSFASVILTVLGISFALFYSGLFVKPIKKLHNGADAIAGGNFKTKLDIKTGDELEQLSNAMNEMAAQLDNSYATLEQRVEERTRGLEESEERLKTITETAGDAIIVMKAPDTIYMWNKKAEEMFGYPAGEAIGRELHKLIAPEICKEKAHKGMQEFFKTGMGAIVGKTVEIMAIRRDGAEFPVELSVSAMNIKGEWHAIGIVRDITERKRAETQLKNSEERHSQIVQTSMDGFWIADTKGRILDVNAAYCGLTGYAREELLNMRIPDVEAKEAPEDTAQHIQEIMAKGYVRFETRHRRKDGQLLDIEASVVYRPDKEDGHFFVFLRDITERNRAEKRLAEQMDFLERFHKAAVQREFRIKELKDRVKELEEELKKGKEKG